MKTFKLENESKLKTGFSTPENYFENFSPKVLQQIPDNDPKVVSFFYSRKFRFYAAAAVLVFILAIPVYINYNSNAAEIDAVTLENYIAYNSSVSDADLLYLLDEKDLQKMNVHFNIEDQNIEEELSTSTNLEHYLLN